MRVRLLEIDRRAREVEKTTSILGVFSICLAAIDRLSESAPYTEIKLVEKKEV